MKLLRASLVLALLSLGFISQAQAETWQGTYGVAKTFHFKLYNADGTLDVDEADSGTEVSLSCDQGAETTATNDFVDEGNFYSIAITAAEMSCRNIAVVIAATTTEVFFIQTDSKPGVIAQGTAQSVTGTTLVLAAATAFTTDSDIVGATCIITSASTGAGQSRTVTAYVTATDTATVATWTTTPTGTIAYECHGTAAGSGSVSIATGGIVAGSFAAGAIDAAAVATGAIDADALAADSIGASEIAADAIGSSEVATDAIGAAELAANSITSSEVADDSIDAGAIAASAIGTSEIATDAIASDEIAATGASEVATAVITAQGTITGTCDSGSTTTCVDNALTQADATQLEDRLICFDDAWCALITTFTPGSDTATTTKVAPSTRASKVYTIFPSTLE